MISFLTKALLFSILIAFSWSIVVGQYRLRATYPNLSLIIDIAWVSALILMSLKMNGFL